MVSSRTVRLAALLALAHAAAACAEDSRPPRLEAVDDQVAAVGTELVITLRATDPDGDDLSYDFTADLDDLAQRASISERPDGTAVFRFTPLGADVGQWPFDFTASDGTHADTVTATIDIRTALEGTAPLFREPLGSGTTLDLATDDCLDLDVVVEDQDDAAVTIGQAEPLIEDAVLEQVTGLTAHWQWCPNKDQLASDRFPLTLFADDGDNEPVIKNYLIVLRPGDGAGCPGKGPTIMHESMDLSTVLDLELTAEVSDDLGLKGPPLVYYSLEEPREPIDFSELSLVEMELQSGDLQLGIWSATVPNPVAGEPEGTTADLYYLFSAVDDDDAEGECDHLTDLPEMGAFAIEVTNPGGNGGAGVCEPCSADVQCGGDADVCAVVGEDGATHCLVACAGGCENGLRCVEVSSVDGVTAEQCMPTACGDEPPPPCEDDAREENDTRAQASMQGAIDPDASLGALTYCEGDEDWFRISVGEDGTVGGLITGGGGEADLDLGLYDIGGAELETAATAGSEELLEACVAPGTYYLRVFSAGEGSRDYDLLYTFDAENCAGVCQDDSAEDDDTPAQAPSVSLPFTSTGRAVCSNDADYHAVALSTGETLVADLTFEHAQGDLDFHFHDTDGTDLTPCPGSCSPSNGQSATDDEHIEWTIDTPGCAPCTFYLSVQGYLGAANTYDLDISVMP
ncbi:MAG: Ig-like domain-containing protein [Nannocystaceae bacterium]|nr:Ig-like domain-containing protein [bacterium]